jgi:hypothetical protein
MSSRSPPRAIGNTAKKFPHASQKNVIEKMVAASKSLAGYGEIDFEGAAQTASSVATNSFNPRMRQLSLEIDRPDLGFHVLAGQSWSLNAPSKVGIDPRGVGAPGVIDFESVPGFLAARQPGILFLAGI